MDRPLRTCPICRENLPNVLDPLAHLGEHSPEVRAAVSRRQVADLQDLMRQVRAVPPK